MQNKEACHNNPSEDLIKQYAKNFKCKDIAKTPTLADKEHYEQVQSNISNKEKVVSTWTEIQNVNMELRDKYANKIFILLAIQVIVVDVIVILLGFSIIKLNDYILTITIIKVFGEIVGFITIIVKYLFKPMDKEVERLFRQLK